MVLIVDSREQRKLVFRESVFEEIICACLPVGDYGCKINGNLVPLVWERKNLSDCFGTMTTGYERFKREIQRAKDLNIKLILLIEGTMREVARGCNHSKFDGDSMLKKLATLYLKYDLEYHFCVDRREMARRIEDTFEALDRLWKKDLAYKPGGAIQ